MAIRFMLLLALFICAATMPDPGAVVNVNVKVDDNNDGPVSESNPKPSGVRCGIVKQGSSRIVGGTEVDVPLKYSWQVSLRGPINGRFKHLCGGSIISDRHILTAAHCVCERRLDQTTVWVGGHDRNVVSTSGQLIRPSGIIVHQDFRCGATTEGNDIAIVELSTPIELEMNADIIHPICLPKDDSEYYANETATITGWGSSVGRTPLPLGVTFAPGVGPVRDDPADLREAQVQVLENYVCGDLYRNRYTIKSSMICTDPEEGFGAGGSSPCQGDSGGPLSVGTTRQVQVGVVSFAQGCAAKGYPNVYTRISKYLEWIKIHTGSEATYTLP